MQEMIHTSNKLYLANMDSASLPVGEKRAAIRLVQRRMLARALQTSEDQLPAISHGPYGKPFLPSRPSFHYNFTDSGDWVALAVSEEEIGIDLQRMVPTRYDVQSIADRFYTQEEARYLLGLSEEERRSEFFYLWTIKEAYLKYLGTGLLVGMNGFRICPADHSPEDIPAPDSNKSPSNGSIRPITNSDPRLRPACYHFADPPETGYCLCVASPGEFWPHETVFCTQ